MILTINFMDATNPQMPKLMAMCNLIIDTDTPEAVCDAYAQTIPQVHTKDFQGTGAEMLAEVTSIVMQKCPGMILLGANGDRKQMASPEHTIYIKMLRK